MLSFAPVWLLILGALAANAAPPVNPRILVNLRIEGLATTIFEGPIQTRGHNITTASGGTHHCDGTNLAANPTPGATCTSALDDASKDRHFPFDGTFDTQFDDYFITSIGPDTQTSTQFWGLLLDFKFTPVGGCQQQVKSDQHILWAFDAFNKAHFLKASGPNVVKKGKAATYTVVDGSTGLPVAGATIGGATTDASGKAQVTFTTKGERKLKATEPNSIRSNAVPVLVN